MTDFPTTQFIDSPDSRPWRTGLAAVRERFSASRWRRSVPPAADQTGTTLSSLSPSLLQDLMRFDQAGGKPRELLEVLAAGLRHTQPLAITVALDRQILTLSMFPIERLVHCPLSADEFLAENLAQLQVLQVQPASLRPQGHAEVARVDLPARYAPLGPLVWGVALRGGRRVLLPELAGQAAYRLSPGASLSGMAMSPALAEAVQRLHGQSRNLREIASWPGLDTEQAMRLLNALYLQSALIVSRSHPAATNEGWAGYDNRGPRKPAGR